MVQVDVIVGEISTFQREKMSRYVIKAMDNVWIVGRAVR